MSLLLFCTNELLLSLGKYQYIMAVLFIATLQNLPNLTKPDQLSIPFPNPDGCIHHSPAGAHLIPTPNPDTSKIKLAAR